MEDREFIFTLSTGLYAIFKDKFSTALKVRPFVIPLPFIKFFAELEEWSLSVDERLGTHCLAAYFYQLLEIVGEHAAESYSDLAAAINLCLDSLFIVHFDD